jgi:tRNA-dihydrouridine synthase
VGNGDILTPKQALERLERGKCAGVMVGRAILGNPVFFERLMALLRGEPPEEHTLEKKMHLAKEHFQRSLERYGERRGLLEMRKQLAFYFRGMRRAARLRESVVREKSPDAVVRLLEEGWRAFQ